MAVFDLIYPEISGHMNGFDRLIAFFRYRAPSWRSLSLRKRIPLAGNRSQVGLSHFSLEMHLIDLFWIFCTELVLETQTTEKKE